MLVLGRDLFKLGGVGVQFEVKYLLPGLEARTADIRERLRSDATTAWSPVPVAYSVTVSSPFQENFMSIGARETRAVTNAAEDEGFS